MPIETQPPCTGSGQPADQVNDEIRVGLCASCARPVEVDDDGKSLRHDRP